MKIVPLLPELHLIKPTFGRAYLWRDGSELTLVDTGVAGSAVELAVAFAELGFRRADLRRIVITHGHEDHAGATAELREWGDVEILVHHLDASAVRGERRRAEPVLTEAEKPLSQELMTRMPVQPPCPVDTELSDGDVIDFGGGAEVIGVPGHTDGSIAIRLPVHGVLFTGDVVVNSTNGLLFGVFNTDRTMARQSFVRLAQMPAETVCFGHGDPLTGPAGTKVWRALGDRCRNDPAAVPDPLG